MVCHARTRSDFPQLTSVPGDERPCNRCIKRGLQDQCQDGVRKKAKYLHDAPAEALMPNFSGNYRHNGSQPGPPASRTRQISSHGAPATQSTPFVGQTSTDMYSQYGSVPRQGHVARPGIDNVNSIGDYTNHQPVQTASQMFTNASQQVSPEQGMPTTVDPPSTLANPGNAMFESGFVDHHDPSLYDVNISELNYDNRYGALEFNMIGHLLSGAANTPDLEGLPSMGQAAQANMNFDGAGGFNSGFGYPFQPWQSIPNPVSRHGSSTQLWSLNNENIDAFAVGETTGSVAGASEASGGQDFSAGYSSTMVSPEVTLSVPEKAQPLDTLQPLALQSQKAKRKRGPLPNEVVQAGANKRRRNTSDVYSSVKHPYPYTQGFHNFIAFLHGRFPPSQVLRIAKALASFRPSFISCNKNLNTDDLVFMEKCFQRTLYEYEDFVNHYGTPTIICRRTSEVAAVSKEFSLVTGWRRDVLLGKEPNLNVNTGSSGSGTETGASTKGTATPRVSNIEIDPGRPQPVFLAELMDQDSVVQFYEDFAELAFGASRSSIIGARCTLLKYKTKDDPGWGPGDRNGGARNGKKANETKTQSLMKGEAGANTLGDQDGKVDAVLCWTVKRDVFDIPMMIVINVSQPFFRAATFRVCWLIDLVSARDLISGNHIGVLGTKRAFSIWQTGSMRTVGKTCI